MAYQNQKVKARQVVTQTQQTQTLGITANVPMGKWNATTQYLKLNTVRSHEATYQAKKYNIGVEPTVTQGWQEVWQVVAYDGIVAPVGNYPEMTVGRATKADNDGNGNNIAEQFGTINSYIQSGTTAENQLTNQAFVNSSINNMAAFYIEYNAQNDAFPTRASLLNATTFYNGGKARVPTQNDYAFVLSDESQPKDSLGNYPTTRYSYQGGTYPNGQWGFQYVVNNTSLTQAQVDAINSGITKEIVDQIGKGEVLSVNGETGAVTVTPAKIGAATEETANKNLYNQGAFDTYTSNGDGTGTVTRKTGYIIFDTLKWEKVTDSGCFNSGYVTGLPMNNGIRTDIKSSNYRYIEQDKVLTTANTYSINNLWLSAYENIFVNTGSPNILPTGIAQYLLPTEYQYTEKVIENQPIHTLDQDGEEWLRDERGKGLNLLPNSDNIALTEDYAYLPIIRLEANTNYTVLITNPKLKTARFGATLSTGGTLWEVHLSNGVGTFNLTQTQIDRSTEFWFDSQNAIGETTSIMLVKGSHPYPYQPYNGGIVREKDLSGIQLFPQNVNPAQTIGGDWEDLGTVTVGSNTLHAYQKVNRGN